MAEEAEARLSPSVCLPCRVQTLAPPVEAEEVEAARR